MSPAIAQALQEVTAYKRHYAIGASLAPKLPTFASFDEIAKDLGLTNRGARKVAMVALGKLALAARQHLPAVVGESQDDRITDRWHFSP